MPGGSIKSSGCGLRRPARLGPPDSHSRTARLRRGSASRYPRRPVGQPPLAFLLTGCAVLAILADFIENHRPHGSLTADATEPAWNGYLIHGGMPVRRYVGTVGDARRSGPRPGPPSKSVETRRRLTPVCLGSTVSEVVR